MMSKAYPRVHLIFIYAALSLVVLVSKAHTKSIDERIDVILSQMTLQEKIDQLWIRDECAGPDNIRLGIPGFKGADGPHGLRYQTFEGLPGQTCFPVSIARAASWDPDLAMQVGIAIGKEALAEGRNMLWGPCADIARDPRAGRTGETHGEDPYLSGKMTTAVVKGVQRTRVIATTKHFNLNVKETNRRYNNFIIDERSLIEFYGLPFRMAIQEGDTWSMMSAYNWINDEPVCQNGILLSDILRNTWHYRYSIMTDWGVGDHIDPAAQIQAGTDIELGAYLYRENLTELVDGGAVDVALIDQAVKHVLRTKIKAGLLDHYPVGDPEDVDSQAHRELALEAAQKSIVLLKNENNILPLPKSGSIALIGPNADVAQLQHSGSAQVTPAYEVTPMQGIQNRAPDVTVRYAQGCLINDQDDSGFQAAITAAASSDCVVFVGGLDGTQEGEGLDRVPSTTEESMAPDTWSARWTGSIKPRYSETYTFYLQLDDGARLWVNDQLVIDAWYDGIKESSGEIALQADQAYSLKVEFYNNCCKATCVLMWESVSQFKEVVPRERLSTGTNIAGVDAQYFDDMDLSVLGQSRTDSNIDFEWGNSAPVGSISIDLPGKQSELIHQLAAVNPNLVVVLEGGGAIGIHDSIDLIRGLIYAFYPGQEGGNAIADVLFGNCNPSGKLPYTIPVYDSQIPEFGTLDLTDEVHTGIGYRWFDKQSLTPEFAFGYGLSYTTFRYDNLIITPSSAPGNETVSVLVDVCNTGSISGEEVVQLYVTSDSASVPMPVKQLKGFRKVTLPPSQKQTVSFTLGPEELSYWSISDNCLKVEAGTFIVKVGGSSDNLPLSGTFQISSSYYNDPYPAGESQLFEGQEGDEANCFISIIYNGM